MCHILTKTLSTICLCSRILSEAGFHNCRLADLAKNGSWCLYIQVGTWILLGAFSQVYSMKEGQKHIRKKKTMPF